MILPAFSDDIDGGTGHKDYNIEGVGNDFIPDTMDTSLIDICIKVNDEQAFSTAKEITRREGVIAGSSSGADLWCALELAKRIDKGNIVVLFPDRGDRYISKGLYD